MKCKKIIVTKISNDPLEPEESSSVSSLTFKQITYLTCVILLLLSIAIFVYGFLRHFENTVLASLLMIATSISLFLFTKFLYDRILESIRRFLNKFLHRNKDAKLLLLLAFDLFGVFLFLMPILSSHLNPNNLNSLIDFLLLEPKQPETALGIFYKVISTIGFLIMHIGGLISIWEIAKTSDD